MELADQVALFERVAVPSPRLQAQVKATEAGQVELSFIDFEDGELQSIRQQTLDVLPGEPEVLLAMFTAAWAWAQQRPEHRMPEDVWDPKMVSAGRSLEDFRAVFEDPERRAAHLGSVEAERQGLQVSSEQAALLFRALNHRGSVDARAQLKAISQWVRRWPAMRGALLSALSDGLNKGWYRCWYDDRPEAEMGQRILDKIAALGAELQDEAMQAWVAER